MIEGFLNWLFGDLKGVQVPKDFSLKSVVRFFLQLMGITWPNIRKILVKKIGAKNVALIEKVWSLVSLLHREGARGHLRDDQGEARSAVDPRSGHRDGGRLSW